MSRAPSNAEIARKLKDIRLLMEFAGEPYFKFMAYERAAETIENAGPVPQLIASDELVKLPGVGKTIAGRIATTPFVVYPPGIATIVPGEFPSSRLFT